MPDTIARLVVRHATPLDAGELVAPAVRKVLDSGLPGLPAVEADGSYAGVFGPHELLSAFFPAYLEELRGAAMISPTVDEVLERRLECAGDPVREHLNTAPVLVEDGYSDSQLAELFLHHRAQVIPVARGGRIEEVVALDDFFQALGERLLKGVTRGAR